MCNITANKFFKGRSFSIISSLSNLFINNKWNKLSLKNMMTHYIQHAKSIYAFQKVLTYLKIFIIVKKFNKLKKIEHVKFAKRKIWELILIQKGTRLKEKAQ
jgi:hypothetical protein